MKNETIQLLEAFASGDYASWVGLPSNLSTAEVELAFGPSGPGEDGIASLGGTLTKFRVYPDTKTYPYGLKVWKEEDKILALQVNSPAIKTEILMQQLGEPETKIPSLIMAFHEQWVYANRGLTFHISELTNEVLRIYAYPKMEAGTFIDSPMAKESKRRIPIDRK